jgi:PAS domain S-box-containing protein
MTRVMELFSSSLHEPDESSLATLTVLGSQIGQYVARRHAEEEVRARESRLRAMLETALDAVVSMDAEGRVTGWNHAATTIFGYEPEEAIGRDMAELIVPPRHRRAHRQGLARFRETERPVILDRRIEVTGRRRDGTEFPVELTITRIPLPGPPTFTGYLRDITDRLRAVEDLRASRARVVAVADVERRRIQANLHDGAQQRLTSALLMLGRVRAAGEEDEALLRQAGDEVAAGLNDIRELARGLHPSLLSERGLAAALQALAVRAPLPGELEAVPDRRLPEQVEAAAYYVVAEALANVQKHAGPCSVAVRATAVDGTLQVEVEDDGAGGADAGGNGLRGLADRVEALGGRLALDSPPGAGTVVRAALPLA